MVSAAKLEEAEASRPRPQLAPVVFKQVDDVFARQAVAHGVSRCRAVRPTAVKAARRRDPQRAAPVFEQVRDVMLLRVVARHTKLDEAQPVAAARSLQPVQAFQSPAPDRTVTPFEDRCDSFGPAVFVLRHDDREHRRRAGGRRPLNRRRGRAARLSG